MANKEGNTARKKERKSTWEGESRPKRQQQQQEHQQQAPPQQHLPESTRQKKLSVSFDQPKSQPESDLYNVLINFQLLKCMFSKLACPQCHSEVQIVDNLQRRGLVHQVSLSCQNVQCDFLYSSYTDNPCKTSKKKLGRQPKEINVRTIISFCEIGHGHKRKENALGCMNIHSMNNNSFTNLNETVANAYQEAAAENMQNAVADVKSKHAVTDPIDPMIIPYPTCMMVRGKRGHASLHGVVTAISEGKYVDAQVLTKYCRMCRIWEPKKGTPNYDEWYDTHKQNCKHNNEQSSGAMESVGAVDIFSRSIDKNELIYTEYLGDGDSSFKDVVRSKPYEKYSIEPTKNECVRHVQKRLGTRLCKKVEEYKGTYIK